MKIEFNQEELVEGILLLLEEQGFKKENFTVQNFRFVSGRGENGDRVEVELLKTSKPIETTSNEPVQVVETKKDVLDVMNETEDTIILAPAAETKKVKDIFN